MSEAEFLPLGLYIPDTKQRKVIYATILDIRDKIGLKLGTPEQRKFFANLCLAYWYCGTDTLIVSFSKRYYQMKGYNKNKLGYTPLLQLCKALHPDSISLKKGEWKGDKVKLRPEGERSELKLTGTFKKLIEQHRAYKDFIKDDSPLIFIKEANS